MGRLIGKKLGRVIDVKTDEERKGIGACLAVRIEIDVRKPLKRRQKIAVEEDQVVFVEFKYERLPALCYCCGIIGHNEADYALAIKKKREGVANPSQYGKWICAPTCQKLSRDGSSYGGRGNTPRQPRVSKRWEVWSKEREEDDQRTKAPAMDEIRGNTVITHHGEIGEENIGSGAGESNKVDKSYGKEKGDMTKALTLLLGKEEKVRRSDDMVWQESHAVSQKPKLGREEFGLTVKLGSNNGFRNRYGPMEGTHRCQTSQQ